VDLYGHRVPEASTRARAALDRAFAPRRCCAPKSPSGLPMGNPPQVSGLLLGVSRPVAGFCHRTSDGLRRSPAMTPDLLFRLSRFSSVLAFFRRLAELRRNWQSQNDDVINGGGVLILVGVCAPLADCQATKASGRSSAR